MFNNYKKEYEELKEMFERLLIIAEKQKTVIDNYENLCQKYYELINELK